ncbi:sugar-binding domain-containing protein [Deinococcus sp. VB142]|uniref:Sugar-binding domain-containing protein n=1 Tax=Deinococcus sp. VB142 TaxID=3112952 RepID=A0AAU6Q4S2_9DEIO
MPLPESAADEEQLTQAVQVARLYYQQQLTTDAIARELGTSRSRVSRLLALARRSGIVDIRIHDPQGRPQNLSARLLERWPGVQFQVVGLPPYASQDMRLERVAVAAAHWLAAALRPGMVVGLAWGNTIDAVSRALPPRPVSGAQFVQLNGSASVLEFSSGFVGGTLTRLAQAVGGQVHLFPVPTFFDDPATKQAMWRERSVQHVLNLQRRAEVLLFSVGSQDAALPSYVYTAGYLDENDVAELAAQGAVGDIATVFFRQDGRGEGLTINRRASGPDLALIRQHPQATCVVADPGKARALRAALDGGLCRTLIVDETTAQAMLDRVARDAEINL